MLKRLSSMLLITLLLVTSSMVFASDHNPGPESADTFEVVEGE